MVAARSAADRIPPLLKGRAKHEKITADLDEVTGIDVLEALAVAQALAIELDRRIHFETPNGTPLPLCPPATVN